VSGEGDLYRFLLYLFSFFSTLMIYYLVFPEFFFFMKTYLFKNNSFIIRFIFICLIFYVFQGIIFKLLKKNPSQKTIVSDFILSKNDNKLNEEFKKNPIATFFIVVIVAPVIEELSFRAGIMGFFNTKSKKEKIVASIISIIVFSSAHYLHYVKNVDEFFGKKF
jgi:membrane protease YdiL (CAAX protease family)